MNRKLTSVTTRPHHQYQAQRVGAGASCTVFSHMDPAGANLDMFVFNHMDFSVNTSKVKNRKYRREYTLQIGSITSKQPLLIRNIFNPQRIRGVWRHQGSWCRIRCPFQPRSVQPTVQGNHLLEHLNFRRPDQRTTETNNEQDGSKQKQGEQVLFKIQNIPPGIESTIGQVHHMLRKQFQLPTLHHSPILLKKMSTQMHVVTGELLLWNTVNCKTVLHLPFATPFLIQGITKEVHGDGKVDKSCLQTTNQVHVH